MCSDNNVNIPNSNSVLNTNLDSASINNNKCDHNKNNPDNNSASKPDNSYNLSSILPNSSNVTVDDSSTNK